MKTIVHHLRVALNSIRKRGLAKTVQLLAGEYWFDLRFGADTSANLVVADTSIVGDHRASASPHYGTNGFILKSAFRNLGRMAGKPPAEIHLLDYGCGAGRALMAALHFGVHRVTGVEFSQALCTRAEHNLTRFARRAPGRFAAAWKIVHADASTYPIPPDVAVFFLYNPFGPPVIETVAENIARHAKPAGTAHLVIYVNPVHAAVFTRLGFRRLPESNTEVAFYLIP